MVSYDVVRTEEKQLLSKSGEDIEKASLGCYCTLGTNVIEPHERLRLEVERDRLPQRVLSCAYLARSVG